MILMMRLSFNSWIKRIMAFKLSIRKIKELIDDGYYAHAFLELMRNRIKWKEWTENYIPYYLVEYLGEDKVIALWEALNTTKSYWRYEGNGIKKKWPCTTVQLDDSTSSIKRLYLEEAIETAYNYVVGQERVEVIK